MGTTVALNAQTNNGYNQGYEDGLAAGEAVCSNLADAYADLQLFTAGVQGDLLAANNLAADLQAQLDALQAQNDSLQAALDSNCEFEWMVIDAALEANAELQAELDAAVAESDTCFMEYSALDDTYTETVFAYEAYIDSLNAIISAVPATIQAIVDPLNAELEAAQECCSSCPAAIETAVDNALEYAYEDCNEHLMQVANANQAMGYEAGYADGVVACEDNNAGELMEVYYNGYAAGLEDCADSVDGITDIDGSLINVIGYYNELGQVIDPRTATGVIIRKHDDGTFSKYIQRLQ